MSIHFVADYCTAHNTTKPQWLGDDGEIVVELPRGEEEGEGEGEDEDGGGGGASKGKGKGKPKIKPRRATAVSGTNSNAVGMGAGWRAVYFGRSLLLSCGTKKGGEITGHPSGLRFSTHKVVGFMRPRSAATTRFRETRLSRSLREGRFLSHVERRHGWSPWI